MKKSKNLEDCPVYKTAELLEGKWTILIFRDLLDKKVVRFNELKRSLGSISPKTLTERLKFLEFHNLIQRNVYPETPPRVEYSLTQKGKQLQSIFEAMAKFGTKWL
ncbi:MAG: helix-turn-helix transcriptional regulator [Bacteriovoracaceae bacterium]|nr:helix-turn-helix transcriptional regulator [Bacteriovoracaceae bacterium]